MRMMVGMVAAVAALMMAMSVASAEVSHLEGSYEFNEAESDEMIDAFMPAIDEMSRFKRGFARRAVRGEPDPSPVLRIEVSDDEVALHYEEEPTVRLPLSGEQVRHEEHDGDIRKVSARVEGQVLVLDSDVEEGEYTTRYELDGDQLKITSHIDFEDLPKVVEYNLVYQAR